MKLNPLSAIYGAVVGARNALYDRHWLRTRSLNGFVISVGNLSSGGSGKTPFVILLGESLKARGIGFDVLSRGYGRKTGGVLLVDSSINVTTEIFATIGGFPVRVEISFWFSPNSAV